MTNICLINDENDFNNKFNLLYCKMFLKYK